MSVVAYSASAAGQRSGEEDDDNHSDTELQLLNRSDDSSPSIHQLRTGYPSSRASSSPASQSRSRPGTASLSARIGCFFLGLIVGGVLLYLLNAFFGEHVRIHFAGQAEAGTNARALLAATVQECKPPAETQQRNTNISPLPTSGPAFDNSAVLHYMAVHSSEAFLQAGGEEVCSRQFVLTSCCSANYGTTLLRVLGALKFAMLLNRTIVMVVDEGNADAADFFQWHILTQAQMKRRLQIHGCPYEHNDASQFVLTPVDSRTDISILNAKEFDCAAYRENPNLPAAGTPAYDNSMPYRQLRCEPLLERWKRFLEFSIRDTWNFVDLLWWNPSWRKSAQAREGYLSVRTENGSVPMVLKELAAACLQPAASIRWVMETFHAGIGTYSPAAAASSAVASSSSSSLLSFSSSSSSPPLGSGGQIDYMIHLRNNRAPAVWPFITGAMEYLRTDVVGEGQPDHRVPWMDPKRSEVYRIFISSATLDPRIFCGYLTGNITAVYPTARLDCLWLNATAFQEQHGLPPDLSLAQVRPQAWDWGVEPVWAAVVNAWSTRFLKPGGRFAALPHSSYAGLMQLAGGVESYSFDNQLNTHVWWGL